MKIRPAKVLALGLGLLFAPAPGAEPPAGVQQEINYLLRYIEDSGCEFKRNGTWNTAKAAEAHVRGKYDFLAKLGKIATAQDFIDKAATKSSLSGEQYETRCASALPTPCGLWLTKELVRYRTSRP